MKVYIWGTGKVTSAYLKMNEVKADDLLGFIESRRSKDSFFGKKVYEPSEVAVKDDYDYIVVCVADSYGRDIYDTCVRCQIDTDKLILADNWEWDGVSFREICRNKIDIKNVFPRFYEEIMKQYTCEAKYVVMRRNAFDLADKETKLASARFSGYQADYVRYRTFELAADEIVKQDIKGNVAELGVFRGDFSALINAKFPRKTLYLFDTFESFDSAEAEREVCLGRCNEELINCFKNTSVEYVMGKMPFPDQCVVKKGLFPDTTNGLENETYAFVSIDVDFEKSTLEGLRYFYPRVSAGGVIFVHDFNSSSLEGIRLAVDMFQNETGITLCKVPLADVCGTLAIMKP